MKESNVTLTTLVAAVVVIVLVGSYVNLVGTGGGPGEGDFVIIHTNDTHGYYDGEEDDGMHGFASVAQLREDYEDAGYTVFVLDAGDAFQGTAVTSFSHGETTIDVMNAVGYDLMCPGNHEFDYTLDTYLGYADRLDFGTVCANLVWEDSGETVFSPYQVLEKDGITLGVFGLLTPDTVGSVMPGYMDGVTVTDPAETARDMVAELQSMDVDYVVALTHLGVDRSSSYTSDRLCADVEGIDICIDGHSHTVMEDGRVADGSIELEPSDTVIASTGSYLNHIGTVTVTSDGIEAGLVDKERRDPTVQAVVDRIYESQEGVMSEVIGYTDDLLTGGRTESRLGETTMGDLAADAMRRLTGADIAVVNGGGIRQDIAPGEITVGEVYDTYPFDNYVQTKNVTGRTIWDMMEASVMHVPDEAAGSYLQVSGMTVTYDSSAPVGHRVVSIVLDDGSDLDLGRTYVLAANDYVMSDATYPLVGIPVESTAVDMARDALIDLIRDMGHFGLDDIRTGRLIDTASPTVQPTE